VTARDQWLACKQQALAQAAVTQYFLPSLAKAMADTADWMRNTAD